MNFLFLTTASESTIISKKEVFYAPKKKIYSPKSSISPWVG